MTRRALLVADAGPAAGLGHVSRSSAVAAALAVRGFETRAVANGVDAPLARDGVMWQPLDRTGAGDDRWDVVVLDSYRLRPDDLELSEPTPPLVVLQESTEPPREASLVVNASADPADAGPGRLYGFAYAALRPGFWGAPHARRRDRVEHIVVTTGAGDVGNAGAILVAAARDAVPGARVTAVRGPFAAAQEVPGVEVAVAPESLLDLLLDADLVVCAGGQTMLEAAAVGAPCVCVALAENQVAQVSRLAELGAVRRAQLETVGDAVAELAADAAARHDLGRRAQSVVDGYGALRVAFAIARLRQA